MRQPAARVLAGAAAWIVLGAAAVFVFRSERHVDAIRSSLRVFDLQARETTDALGELRSAQQAYVVGGQGVAFWVAKVVTTGDVIRADIGMMRQAATALITRAALDDAAKALRQFGDADKRALEYINSGQPLMAGDVVFTEGGQAASAATQHVEAARMAERQDVESRESSARRQEAMVIGAATGLVGILVLLLVPVVASAKAEHADATSAPPVPVARADGWQQPHAWNDDHPSIEYARPVRLMPAESSGIAAAMEVPANGTSDEVPAQSEEPSELRLSLDESRPADGPRLAARARSSDQNRLTLDVSELTPVVAPPAAPGFLKAAADLATDFGRVQDVKGLTHLIARAASLTDASGVVVWLGNAQGIDLRPVLTYGYSPQVVNRLAPVPRSASNAAAAAYRTGTLQVVPSQPFSSGAIVAPILGPDGCIGALSAEFRGAEASESVQAFTAIIAAHLAGVFGSAASDAGESRLAAG